MMKTLYKTLLITIPIVIVVAVVAMCVRRNPSPDEITVAPARISALSTMADLCTVEIYSEVPVIDTIGTKVLCGIQKQRGFISFPLDSLSIDSSSDTVRAILPPEIITIYESTEPDSWQVVDSRNLKFLGSSKLSIDEENLVKRRAVARSRRELYRNGTVRRARMEAANNLTNLLEKVYHKAAVVSDPTPRGDVSQY